MNFHNFLVKKIHYLKQNYLKHNWDTHRYLHIGADGSGSKNNERVTTFQRYPELESLSQPTVSAHIQDNPFVKSTFVSCCSIRFANLENKREITDYLS